MTAALTVSDAELDKAIVADGRAAGRAEHGRVGRVAHGSPVRGGRRSIRNVQFAEFVPVVSYPKDGRRADRQAPGGCPGVAAAGQ